MTDDGTVLDTWYPSPALGDAAPPATPAAVPAELAALEGADPHRRVRQTVVRHGRSTSTPRRPTSPTPTCACTCSRTGSSRPHGLNLDRALRRAPQRGVDQPRPVRRRGLRARPGCACGRRRSGGEPGRGLRRRQVPADDRLRRPLRRADRRRRPGPARRPPRRRARRSCTRASSTSTPAPSAPRWSRAGSRPASSSATAPTSAAAPRSWARSPAAAQQVDLDRPAQPARRERRDRDQSRRRLRRRGRLLRHRGDQGARCCPRARVVKAGELSGAVGLLFRRNSLDRGDRGRAPRRDDVRRSTRRCTPTTETRERPSP